jgi:hypothetical protein
LNIRIQSYVLIVRFEYVTEGNDAMLHYACIACEAHFPKLSSLSDHYATVHSDDTVGIEGNAAHLEIQADILLQAETVNGMRKLISSYKRCMTLTQVLDRASTSTDIDTDTYMSM